ncbi:hypothetical protein A9Q99_00310 [Gammaproteobacteria bacterium 45_16_T64]|nr:hypothetical protein A9Q99_00310 [Gammaproteobacteria bacterium 45_16_T64]
MVQTERDEQRPAILVVDDIAANRYAIKRLLTYIDADIIEAESGHEALALTLRNHNLAMILLDVQMPIMDGYEVAEMLRAERQTKHIPIIFITAVHRDESHVLKGYTSGAIDYITKPVQPEILVAKISLFMELWRLRYGLEREVRARINLEDKNRYMADHDLLTDLPNRRRLFQEIERATSRADREKKEFALLFIDLDGFKSINDSLGHKTGDQVLITIAHRLERLIRKSDTLARFGGDEFVMLLTDIDDSNQLTGRIEKILSAVKKTINIEPEEIELSASIGICIYPDQIDDPAKLLDYSDIAMYKAKQAGKNTFRFFSEEMDAAAHKRIHVEKHLRHAMENNELTVHYQPVVKVANGDPVGVEALLRWNNPELGSVPPDYFIPIAESTGLIHSIGAWVFEESITQLAVVKNELDLKLTVAVNASTLQFKNSIWHQIVRDAIMKKRIDAKDLEIEITESLLLDDSKEMTHQLLVIKELGVSLSVDDFGTGYSSLSYLKRCPVQTVKIDRSFIMGIPNSKEDMVLVRAIIAMAHGLEMEVIAEGIETEEQWEFLKKENCDFAQGYYFSKPLPIDSLKSWLRK